MPGHQAQTTVLDDGIVAIDTEYARPLQDASHLIVEGGRAAFVDTGVNSSVPLLIDALAQQDLDVGDVDYVFLTHVHLDHAGGAGLLMQHLPNASCVVHRYGAPHMIDPGKLVAGAEAVYGESTLKVMRAITTYLTTRSRRVCFQEIVLACRTGNSIPQKASSSFPQRRPFSSIRMRRTSRLIASWPANPSRYI